MENSLPKGWSETTLGAIADWASGGTPKSTESKYYGGDIPWLIIGDLNDSYITKSQKTITRLGLENSSAKIAPIGSVLCAMYGSIGKLGITSMPCATNQAIAFTERIHGGIPNKFLFYYLFSQKQNLLDIGKGGAQQNISQTVLKQISIPLPPVPEQQRIVAKLDELMAKIDRSRARLERIPQILKRFRQSVLSAAVTGKLTEEWRDNGIEIERTLLGKLLDDLKYGTSQKSEKKEKGTPILRIPNISDGVIVQDDLKYSELTKNEYERLKLVPGDILLIRSNGSVSLVGKAAIVSEQESGFAYAGYLIRLRCNKEKILPEFLNLALASFDLRLQIELPARSTSGVNNINSEEVRALIVPTPSIEEQKEIVRSVENLFGIANKIESRYNKAKAQLDKLPQSLLAKAFRGELVPQDENDEPASVLLERIHQGNPAKPGKGRKPRGYKMGVEPLSMAAEQ